MFALKKSVMTLGKNLQLFSYPWANITDSLPTKIFSAKPFGIGTFFSMYKTDFDFILRLFHCNLIVFFNCFSRVISKPESLKRP